METLTTWFWAWAAVPKPALVWESVPHSYLQDAQNKLSFVLGDLDFDHLTEAENLLWLIPYFSKLSSYQPAK